MLFRLLRRLTTRLVLRRALARLAAARAAAAGFPPTVPTPVPGLRNGLLVLRRHGRVVLVPIDEAGARIASWPLHPSVRQREKE